MRCFKHLQPGKSGNNTGRGELDDANSEVNNTMLNSKKILPVGDRFFEKLVSFINKLSHASGASDLLVIDADSFPKLLTDLNIKSRDMILKQRKRFYGSCLTKQNLRFALWMFTLASVLQKQFDPTSVYMIDDLRKKLTDIKTKDIWFNGLDQGVGLAELDSKEDETLYVKEWSEKTREYDNIDLVFSTIELLSVQGRGFMIPKFRDWISKQSITELLTSGSLGLNGDNSEISRVFKKYFNSLEDKDELKINSKKALLLIPETELIDAVCHDVLNNRRTSTYNVVSARDYNKSRYIVNSDIVTYFAMKYLYETSKKTKTYTYGRMRLHISSLLSNTEFEGTYYLAMRVLRENGVVAGMDYTRFDFQPTWEEIKKVLICFFGESDVCKCLIHVLERSTYLRDIRTGNITKYLKGIMSGWYLTSWLDSIINICWFVAAMRKNGYTQKSCDFFVLGDDSLLISNEMTYSMVDDVVGTLQETFGLNINKQKTEKGNGVTYLRQVITKTGVNGFPLRAVNSLLTFNEKNASEYVANHSEDFSSLDTSFSTLNKLCSRLNIKFAKEYFYNDIDHNKNIIGSKSEKIHFANSNKIYGGCGYPLGDEGKFNITVELIKWRGESRGQAFAQGGIRYKKEPFVKVQKKVFGSDYPFTRNDYNYTYNMKIKLVEIGRYMYNWGEGVFKDPGGNDALFFKLLFYISELYNTTVQKALDVYRYDRNEVSRKLSIKTGLSKSMIKKVLDINAVYSGAGWAVVGLVDRAQKMILDIVNHYYSDSIGYHLMPWVMCLAGNWFSVKA